MIEKLEALEGLQHNWLDKINELVDAVNNLQKDYDNVCIWVGEQKLNYNPDTTKGSPTLEQRKWIGKLCRFRHGLGVAPTYGILGEILPNSDFPYYKKDTDTYWKYCEPVKPDDDIVYKGKRDGNI